MEKTAPAALVLFSGGQDSAICLAWALSRYERVETVGFDYGQRHRIELAARDRVRAELAARFPQWGRRLGPDHRLGLPVLGEIAATALTRAETIEEGRAGELPNTFVPGRNLLFFTLAGALAVTRGIQRLVGGMCQTDYSGYPDCRDDTLKSQQVTLNLGLEADLVIETPLMWLTKAETFSLAETLGGEVLLEIVLEETHTCYLGERGTRHGWGYGCGRCPACRLRASGYEAWQAARAR